MKIGGFGKGGLVGLQIWLLIFGLVAVVGMMGLVSGGDEDGRNPKNNVESIMNLLSISSGSFGKNGSTPPAGNTNTGGSNLASEYLGQTPGSVANSLTMAAGYAVTAYYGGKMLGGAVGMSDDNSEALGTSLAAGAFVYKGLSTYSTGEGVGSAAFGETGYIGGHAGLISAGIAAVIFVSMYKKKKTETVSFDCLAWQAPNGGDSCEICNDDNLPCSEYRCKALGQSCEIVNEGSEEERCVYVNPKDVSPPIINPNYDDISAGHEYKNVKSSPPGPGFEIVNTASRDGCLKAFAPLEFGITTDEPAQCKIDFNHTTSYDDMVSYFGGDNLYAYNHSEAFSLPGAEEIEDGGFALTNGKDMTFFLRCKDKNGNTNEAEYAVNFCVDPSPDTTPPKIEATSIINGGCVAADTDVAKVVFYVNEPSNCRWSFMDQDYDLMTEDMSCSTATTQINALTVFGCSADLTGIPRDGADYYVRCMDQPGASANDRNKNAESFKFSLRGSNALTIRTIKPNGTVSGGVSPAPVELYVETLYGCNKGQAICKWSSDGNTYIDFFDTDKADGVHTQRLDLTAGDQNYYVKCIDEGGNVAEDVASFNVDIDTNVPVVARVYEESGMLKIVTVRKSECSYSLESCDFSFSEGVGMPASNTLFHVTEWGPGNTYYIKCRDEFLNEGPKCSIVVRPTENFL